MSDVIVKDETKQDKVVEMVKAGKYTRKEILEAVGCTSGALASYLSGMRNAARYTGAVLCPVEVAGEVAGEKVFTVMTIDEAETQRAESTVKRSSGPAKSPSALLDLAQKRVDKAARTETACKLRLDKDSSEVNQLYYDAAVIEGRLAALLLEAAKELVANSPEEDLPADPETTSVAVTEDELI